MNTVYPIGTTVYNPEKCCSGYTLLNQYTGWSARARMFQQSIGPENSGEFEGGLALIDMNGSTVHTWKASTDCVRAPFFQKNGNVLIISMQQRGDPREYNWNGDVIWEYSVPLELRSPGSSAWRLENGNTLVMYKMPMPDAARMSISDPKRRNMENMVTDCIAEVTPDGEIIWDWKCHEHLDLNAWCKNDPDPNWSHFNNIQPLPENKWYDLGDKRFKPGNLLVSGRNLGFIFIVEKETGEIIWRYYGDYYGGMAGQHSPFMIQKGYPGEGNILVFDNGQSPLRVATHGGRSFALELNPSSNSVVWVYDNEHYFFNAYGGHCERLINGNTLIAESWGNRTFEVTMEGEVVWEYVADMRDISMIMDVKRVPYDYCPQLAALPKPKEKAVVPPKHAVLTPSIPCERKE